MLATGSEKLERMRDGRVVYIGAERVDDVTTPSGVPQRRAHHRGALRPQGRSGASAISSPSRRTASASACNGCAAARARIWRGACAP